MNKVFGTIQEALILALMLVSAFAIFYLNIELTYKIAIAIFAFTIIFLATIANAILQQQKEARKQQANQA